MSAPEYLTRGQALDLIDRAEDAEEDSRMALALLALHWLGYIHCQQTAEEMAGLLRECVDGHCVDGDEIRARGPSDSDTTDLEDPT